MWELKLWLPIYFYKRQMLITQTHRYCFSSHKQYTIHPHHDGHGAPILQRLLNKSSPTWPISTNFEVNIEDKDLNDRVEFDSYCWWNRYYIFPTIAEDRNLTKSYNKQQRPRRWNMDDASGISLSKSTLPLVIYATIKNMQSYQIVSNKICWI